MMVLLEVVGEDSDNKRWGSLNNRVDDGYDDILNVEF